jgi:hypothetical protein
MASRSYLRVVKTAIEPRRSDDRQDVDIPGGCILCGGDLAVRFAGSVAVSFCPQCRWISHPRVRREGGSVYMMHPAGGIA